MSISEHSQHAEDVHIRAILCRLSQLGEFICEVCAVKRLDQSVELMQSANKLAVDPSVSGACAEVVKQQSLWTGRLRILNSVSECAECSYSDIYSPLFSEFLTIESFFNICICVVE